MTKPPDSPAPGAGSIDPRGPRFTASITAILLIAALLSPRWVSLGLLSAQALFFASGVAAGVQRTPTGLLFRRFIRPRLAAPAHLEDPRPPRFAQAVGLAFALIAVVGYASGATVVGAIAAGFALAAALLNAVFGYCLGCELYLLIRRIAPGSGAESDGQATTTSTTSTSTTSTEFTNNKKEAIA